MQDHLQQILRRLVEVERYIGRQKTLDHGRITKLTVVQIASGEVTLTRAFHAIQAETGTTDTLVTIAAASDGDRVLLRAKSGDTITVKHDTDNIFLNGANMILRGRATLELIYDINYAKWLEVSRAEITGRTVVTISAGAIEATGEFLSVAAETGTTDNLDTITGGRSGEIIVLRADTGDMITVGDLTGNIDLSMAMILGDNDTLTLIYDDESGTWLEMSRSMN